MYIRKLKVKLGEILLEMTNLSPEQLKESLTAQARTPSKVIGEILIENGLITKEDVDTALAVQQGYPYINVSSYKIEPQILKKISSDLMRKFTFVPLDLVADNLTITMSNTAHMNSILEELKNYKVKIFISTHKEIAGVLSKYLWIR
jgi:type IV pilus assembly protein PilB